ncbi:class I SAM-dependent methyltransferase [Salinispira pacifica]|uniref:Methyltransferase n=1 Tax=Salinispira pacifica TaxID=1307761 RepID=V5WNR6_9SPIO|nr:class I SAM-dependent methyltransferase [Salinispira pacifica]AHC16716.1 Methyltransferase [Salinispira pacifica]
MAYLTCMALYQKISESYEELFPSSQEKLEFVMGFLPEINSSRVIDIGCATGQMLFQLRKAGISSGVGIDLDEHMIREGERRLRRENISGIEFHVGDMRHFSEIPGLNNADLISCMGNTLAYLPDSQGPDSDSLDRFLEQCKSLLAAEGILVIQILNYQNPRIAPGFSFPEISANGIQLLRTYEQSEGNQYRFISRMKNLQTGETSHDIHYHTAFLSKDIAAAAVRQGFGETEITGSYAGKAPQRDDFFHLVICRR